MTSISTLTAVASAICTAFMAFAQPSHSGTSRRGSGDALFSWVDEIIRKTWREQHFSSPWAQATRPTTHRFPDRDWVDRQPSSDREVNPRRSPTGQEAPVASRSDILGRGTADRAAVFLPTSPA